MILLCYDGSADKQAALDIAADGAKRATAAGLGGVKSLMVGSVSQAVLHHADRPVLVVPSPSLAKQRHHWADHAQVTAGIT